jgi:hypothetical protein
MTQIEAQCGPHRVVSLMSTEAAQDLGLQRGSLIVAVIQSTQVLVEIPTNRTFPRLRAPDRTRHCASLR